jgi:hypothetical protein
MHTINEAFAKAADASGHEHGADGKFTSKSGKSYKTSQPSQMAAFDQTHLHDGEGEHVGYVRPQKDPSNKNAHVAYHDSGVKMGAGTMHWQVGGLHSDKNAAMHALADAHESREK